jgi:hypothetical protein
MMDRKLTWGDRIGYLIIFALLIVAALTLEAR